MKIFKYYKFYRLTFSFICALCLMSCNTIGNNLNLNKLMSGATKAVSAMTLSDNDVKQYVHEYIVQSDATNKIAPQDSEYAKRLSTLTQGLTEIDGTPLNFKVYMTNEINAFACADGSVRVYSGLMDIMSDDEVLGVIGHEIGHVAHKDTKNAMKQAMINSALFDGLGSTNDKVAALTDSQLGVIGQSLLSSKYSRNQESNADDFGYDFLKSNGKNPWSMAMAFSKLQSMEGGSKSSMLSNMFSSHPQTKDRIQHIVDKCKKDNIAPPAGCNLQ